MASDAVSPARFKTRLPWLFFWEGILPVTIASAMTAPIHMYNAMVQHIDIGNNMPIAF